MINNIRSALNFIGKLSVWTQFEFQVQKLKGSRPKEPNTMNL